MSHQSVTDRARPCRSRLGARNILLMFVLLCLGGCSEIAYYGQAVHGELSLLSAREPIPKLLQNPSTPAPLRRNLAGIQQLRRFARDQLDLPVGDNYSTYVALDRPYVAWNVVASQPLALKAYTWCYPVIGCHGYRGFFHQADAQALANQLRAKGLDTWVGGVPAYSTLGWFDDPVLSTFWDYPETARAGLVFHELAHRVLFVKGDTTFNESFATTVQEEGVRRWLEQRGTPAQRQAWLSGQQRQAQIDQWQKETVRQLQKLYGDASLDYHEKRRRKAHILLEAQTRLRALITRWPGVSSDWPNTPLNNAKLMALQQYTGDVPAFRALLTHCNGQLPAFYNAARQLAERAPKARRGALQQLQQGAAEPAGTFCGQP
ncbi:aminopeptidase [Mangrovitalea sediminis]|uniref:aminopeptidase n=1 Tax=Mangrovitalea sediminis TaxID=1982043 RepID=UPI000BE5D327|nr:aminopeptidase [Mangrovitalea sediminis]